jgi:hypothetical protein
MTGRQRTATAIEARQQCAGGRPGARADPRLGVLGAAWAVALAGILRNLSMVVAVQRSLGIRSAVV